MTKNTQSRLFAGFIGIMAAGTDTWMNVEYVLEAEKAITSLVVAVPLSSLIAAASLPYMGLALQGRKVFEWTGFFMLFVLTASFSFTASLDRSGASRDKVSQHRVVQDRALQVAQDGFNAANIKFTNAYAHVQGECSGIYSVIFPKTKGHKPGYGKTCKIKKAEMKIAQTAVTTAHKEVLQSERKVSKDSMAIRIASLLPVSVTQVQQYQPMILPLALQLGGLLFIGFAFAPASMQKPVKPVSAKPGTMSKKEIAIAYFQAQLAKGRSIVPLEEIANLKGVMVHKSTISRWLSAHQAATA